MPDWEKLRSPPLVRIALVGAVAGLQIIMMLLGLFFVNQSREMAMQNVAIEGGLYVEGFLAPHAREFLEGTAMPAESIQELELALMQPNVLGRIAAFKLWALDGNLVFSSEGSLVEKEQVPDDLTKAIAGEVVAELYTAGVIDENTLVGQPLIEIHAPIHDAASAKIIAVGEIYKNAELFLRHRAQIERSIWLAVAFASIGLSGLMLMLAARHRELAQSLAQTRAIASHNHILSERADQARLQASQSNEDLLNRLGAELHDGPIQMLSLIMLMQGKEAEVRLPQGGLTVREITLNTMMDLRAISAGLILPEIAELTLEDALRLAVARHEELSGMPVKLTLSDLPEQVDQALKTCCYRLIQEGLTNASKHGGNAGAQVAVHAKDGWLIADIRNESAKTAPSPSETGRSAGLGLQGLRARIDVFGGELRLVKHPAGGADLLARLPLNVQPNRALNF